MIGLLLSLLACGTPASSPVGPEAPPASEALVEPSPEPSPAPSPEPPPDLSTVGWLVEPIAPEGAPCPGTRAADPVARTVRLKLYRGPRISETVARTQLQRMAGFWAAHGVQLELDPVASGVAGPMLAGDPTLADRSALLADTFAGLRAFVDAQARPPDGTVRVVITETAAVPDSAASRAFRELAGLTFSPDLPVPEGAPFTLAEALGSEAPYSPVILLGMEAILLARPGTVDLVAAHELGHALGLVHTRDRASVMQAGRPRCVPGLLPEEVGLLRRGAGARASHP